MLGLIKNPDYVVFLFVSEFEFYHESFSVSLALQKGYE